MPPSHRSSVQNWRVIGGVYQHVHGSIIDFQWFHSGCSYSDHGARWAMLTNVYQEGTLQVIPSIYAVKRTLTRQVMIWMRSCDPSWKIPTSCSRSFPGPVVHFHVYFKYSPQKWFDQGKDCRWQDLWPEEQEQEQGLRTSASSPCWTRCDDHLLMLRSHMLSFISI